MKRAKHAAPVLGALGALGLIVAASGVVSMKASTGHWSLTERFLRFGMRRSIALYSLLEPKPPDLDDAALVLKGAGHFETSCRSCHGAPDLPQSRVARRMLPRPPELSKRVPDRTPRELFFAVKHGLKFTGMPAWTAEGRDDEVWAVVAFLRALPRLDAGKYHALVRGEPHRVAVSQQIPTAVAQSCARCHGADGLGRGDGAFPPLAGQPRAYLEGQLRAYAAGERRSGLMEPVAAALTPESARDLAAWYAALRPPRGQPAREAASAARGEALARRGVPARGVPACMSCHGLGGASARPEFPRLAGLPASYLSLQLSLLRDKRRGGSPYARLMEVVAERLTEQEARDAAAFYGASPPAAP
jgi:cytochrome c553